MESKVRFVLTVAVTLLLVPVCTTTQGVGTSGVDPTEAVIPSDGLEPPGTRIEYRVRTSIDVMVAHVLCSLCDSIQNQSQKRRCKQQNCLARILWW